jgi:putative chitinase
MTTTAIPSSGRRGARRLAARSPKAVRLRSRRIDAGAIRHVCPGLTRRQARQVGRALGPAFERFDMTTPARAAAAVAQFAHESAHFSTTTEFATGSAYEGRRDLGNTEPGDGVRFKGRGFIQITGRANYAAVTRAFRHDFLARPADLAKPRWAALASCWWWEHAGCNQIADRGDFVALTRRINGGLIGLAEREALHERALAVAHRLLPR